MAIRKIIEIDKEKCDACGECIPSCAEHALFIEDNELKIREDKLCDGLGACLNNCPKDALRIIEREAEDFDHKAVEEFIACNSLKPISFENSQEKKQEDLIQENNVKTPLQNWPVKLSLVSSKAAFFENPERLVIAADCAAFACSSFHSRYTKMGIVLIACPRLEQKESLVDKLAEIFEKVQCQQISIVRMEVPCCVLPELVEKALKKSNTSHIAKINVHIVTRDGKEQLPKLFA